MCALEKLLSNAHKRDPKNLLYKWAVRGNFNWTPKELLHVENELKTNLKMYLIEDDFILDYFKDVLDRNEE